MCASLQIGCNEMKDESCRLELMYAEPTKPSTALRTLSLCKKLILFLIAPNMRGQVTNGQTLFLPSESSHWLVSHITN